MKKIKLVHAIMPNLLEFLNKIKNSSLIQRIIPGKIYPTKSVSSGLKVRITSETKSGLKLMARHGSSCQEVFIVVSQDKISSLISYLMQLPVFKTENNLPKKVKKAKGVRKSHKGLGYMRKVNLQDQANFLIKSFLYNYLGSIPENFYTITQGKRQRLIYGYKCIYQEYNVKVNSLGGTLYFKLERKQGSSKLTSYDRKWKLKEIWLQKDNGEVERLSTESKRFTLGEILKEKLTNRSS